MNSDTMRNHGTSMFRCLVVDDEPLVRQLAVRHLQRHNVLCDSVGDGSEAASLLDGGGYDGVLVDLQIPGKNGHALCVKALSLKPPPLVTVMTGLSVPQVEADLRRRGINQFYRKPVDMGVIAREIREGLDERSTSQLPAEADESNDFPAVEDAEHEISTAPDAERASEASTSEHFVIEIFCREKERSKALAKRLRSAGYSASAAQSSDDLLETLNSTRVDLLVIENELKGFLSGLQIIEMLFDQLLSVSVVLLTSEAELDLADKPAMESILRRFDSGLEDDDRADAILQVIKTMTGRHLMIDHRARQLVADAEGIPPMPHVLAQIVKHLEQPVAEIPLQQLSQEIEIDPRLTSELLRVVNSSHSGVVHKVTGARDAVRLLGAKRAISLCLALGVRTMNSELLKPWSGELRDWYLKRVTLTASTASIFAQRFEKVPHETAFLLGILQDLGILVFAEHYGEKYFARVVQRVRSVATLSFVSSEKLVTNTDHAQVSAAVLRLWRFPPTIIEPVMMHHQPIAPTMTRVMRSFVKCMRVAELFADFADNPAAQRRKALFDFVNREFEPHAGECGAALLDAVAQSREMGVQLRTPQLDSETLTLALERLEQADDSEE